MTMPRNLLLRQPHMLHIADHPALAGMTDGEVAALEAFMGFCADQKISEPRGADFQAFATLCDQGPDRLLALSRSLEGLGVDAELIGSIGEAEAAHRHRAEFKGIAHGRSRPLHERRVSVDPGALPGEWRKTLGRLRGHRIFAGRILDRMESRLCMFVWSARQAGLPADLSCIPALAALYRDMRARSAARNEGGPRWAYLRGTWEELRRFAGAHGLPGEVSSGLSKTYELLAQKEACQASTKFAKLRHAGSASHLLTTAGAILDDAATRRAPQHRHALRNRAAAIALGIAVPARPEDVGLHHVLGHGLLFEPGRGAYRFHYTPQKTGHVNPDPVDIPLLPDWNRYIDALILQDHDPAYLGELRAQAIEARRPLYVNYDGSPCAYAWYSRMWHKVAGTGGTIARSLVYDEMAGAGEFGVQYCRTVNHHFGSRITEKYRSDHAKRVSILNGQSTMLAGHGDDDISDLL